MKALIFGAGGQLGRALVAEAGVHEARGLTRETVDIGTPEAAAEAIADIEPDWVFNAAAMTGVDAVETAGDEAMRVNGEAPGAIAAACARHGARLAQVSTDYIFGGASPEPIRPDAKADPLSAYGRSKLAGEIAVRGALPDALIVRSAWIYAAGSQNFATAMLGRMAKGESLRIVADRFGTPTHAQSLARSIWSLAEAGAQGIHHFTDAGSASWYDFAVAIGEEAAALGLIGDFDVTPIAGSDYPAPAERPRFSLLDCSATWAITGIPRHWRAELREMLQQQAGQA